MMMSDRLRRIRHISQIRYDPLKIKMKYLYFPILFCLFFTNCSTQKRSKINVVKEYLLIGGIEQYVEIHKQESIKDILLFIHGGPGVPIEDYFIPRISELTEYYTVVFWHQRGTAKTCKKNQRDNSISINQITKDALELINHLKNQDSDVNISLVGHSFGTIITMNIATEHAERINKVFAISQIVNPIEGYKYSVNWLRYNANLSKSELNELNLLQAKMDSEDSISISTITKLNEILGNNNGLEIRTEDQIPKIASQEDIDNFKCQTIALLSTHSDMIKVNFKMRTEINIPITFLNGRHDQWVPSELAFDYYKNLNCSSKEFIWFENSGHTPYLNELDKVIDVITNKNGS